MNSPWIRAKDIPDYYSLSRWKGYELARLFKAQADRCDVVKDGKILFDTSKNKTEYISKYSNGEIDCLWADVKHIKGVAFGDYFKAVMKCYVVHDSWKSEGSDKE